MSLEQIHFFKKGHRKLSPLFAQYLAYDYSAQKLDSQRQAAFEQELLTSTELQLNLQKLQIAKAYLDQLSRMQVSEDLAEHFRSPRGYLRLLIQKIKWDEWPDGLKLGLESLFVIVGVLFVSLLVPWNRVLEMKWSKQDFIVLSEFNRPLQTALPEVPTAAQEPLKFPDDESKKEIPDAGAPPDKDTVMAVAELNSETATEKKGFLYRGQMVVTNLEAVSPKFVEKISELGGRKAGDVPLGWIKPSGSYFHFTIPETKYPSLLEFAKDFGGIKIQKEKHERQMPTGIIRIILEIKDKEKRPENQNQNDRQNEYQNDH